MTRRDFLKLAGVTGVVIGTGGIAALQDRRDAAKKLRGTTISKGICSGCGLGCGILKFYRKDELVYVCGDPGSFVNAGSLCPKGTAVFMSRKGQKKRSDCLLRTSSGIIHSLSFEKAAAVAGDAIYRHREARINDDPLYGVHFPGVLAIAGGEICNEEAYYFSKICRLAGVQAVTSEPAVHNEIPGRIFREMLGVDALPNPEHDIANSHVILIIGADPCRSRTVLMKHILQAKARGARMVVVDPVQSRTAMLADLHLRILPGTDALFLAGVSNHLVRNKAIHANYLARHTDASFFMNEELVNNGFAAYIDDERGWPKRDNEFRNRQTVMQNIRERFSSLTATRVVDECGCSSDSYLAFADMVASVAGAGRTMSVVVGNSLASSVAGEQVLREIVRLQLLLGNIGVRGGGIYTGYESCNGRGVRDQIPDPGRLPGNLPLPDEETALWDQYLKKYAGTYNPANGDFPALETSAAALLRAWFRYEGQADSETLLSMLPRTGLAGESFEQMISRNNELVVLWGTNMNAPMWKNAALRANLSSARDIIHASDDPQAAAAWWRELGHKGDVLIICTEHPEDSPGAFVSASRLVQQTERRVVDNTGLDALHSIFKQLRQACATRAKLPAALLAARCEYNERFLYEQIGSELCGAFVGDNEPVTDYRELSNKDVVCGNWLYAGYNAEGTPAGARRKKTGRNARSLHHDFAWSTPANIRVLYNRAGLDESGQPFDTRLAVVGGPDQRASGDKDQVYGRASAVDGAFCNMPGGVARMGVFSKDLISSPGNAPGAGLNASRECVAVCVRNTTNMPERLRQVMQDLAPQSWCEINKALADALGLVNGDLCRLRVQGGGQVETRVLVSTRLIDIAGKSVVAVFGAAAAEIMGLQNRTFSMILAERI